jgi:hypothetical protein
MKIAINEVLPFDPRGKLCTAGLLTALFLTAFSSGLAAHKTSYQPENGFVTQIKSGEADVVQAVEGVMEDQIIHGTYSYEKERTLYGAHATSAAPIFGRWDDAGRVFYKVAPGILAPRFFKDSGDIGTIWVRYVVEPVDPSQTNLRIDAVFVDARNVIHRSAGEVEAAEYRAIQDRLAANQDEKQLARESTLKNKENGEQSREERQVSAKYSIGPDDNWAVGLSMPQLEQRVSELRREAELQVRDSGALLKSAPFRKATTLASLAAKTEVAVVVLTPNWYGVETADGHRGWIHRSQLEPVE